ncbi:MAG TPA: hypothetical protein VN829_08700 [Dongiaceae bacterium]|nr:hypothetical protein [Dongiaceae bacterium]
MDLFRALEHLFELTTLLHPDPLAAKALWREWREQSPVDEVAEVITQARARTAKLGGRTVELAGEKIAYFEHNQGRMLYANQFDQIWDRINQSDYLRLRLADPPQQAAQVG